MIAGAAAVVTVAIGVLRPRISEYPYPKRPGAGNVALTQVVLAPVAAIGIQTPVMRVVQRYLHCGTRPAEPGNDPVPELLRKAATYAANVKEGSPSGRRALRQPHTLRNERTRYARRVSLPPVGLGGLCRHGGQI